MDPIETLFTFSGKGIQTFDAMQRLDARLGFPHKAFRSVHVGGTNGKGSVCWKVAEGLKRQGYKVGLYTSPHIHCFRERILINGEMIPEETSRELLQFIFSLVDEELSFFDLLTALAFMYFAKEGVDWAVVEVGLGGRLDATNVIHPAISVITTIGYDHMHLLGNTLEKIAQEKGGIRKAGVPLMVGPNAFKFFPEAKIVPVGPTPFYDDENSGVAKAVLKYLQISEASIAHAMQVRPPCRFEILGNTILDVAHNSSGFERLLEALQFHFPNEKFHFIVAFSKDKDWKSCLELMKPYAAHISFVSGDHPRFAPLGNLKIENVLGTFAAREVVCGSFYIMAEAREAILRLDKSKER